MTPPPREQQRARYGCEREDVLRGFGVVP
jgi:hypothetical protein